MELKFPCTGKTTVKDFEKFVEAAKAFPRKMMIVYNDMHRKELPLQPDMAELLDSPTVNYQVAKHGFHKYGNISGVTVKRTMQENLDNKFADSSMFPRLYPNGNYNRTWANELNDPYLGQLGDF